MTSDALLSMTRGRARLDDILVRLSKDKEQVTSSSSSEPLAGHKGGNVGEGNYYDVTHSWRDEKTKFIYPEDGNRVVVKTAAELGKIGETASVSFLFMCPCRESYS